MASADYPHGSEPYSTLEVRSVETSNPQTLDGSNKEVVSNPDHSYPQVVDPQTQTAWDAPKPESPYADTEATAVQGQPNQATRRTICGLSPRIFYVILAGAILIVIGAIVGGVAGGLAGKKNSSNASNSPDSSTPGSGTTANVNVLGESKLAASNWTDPSGYVHRSVFFQDPTNAIIARQWDSQNKTWTTRNVSQFMQSSTSGPINPLPGTSLASASCSSRWGSLYQVLVWFSEAGQKNDVISWVNSNNPVNNPNFWVYNNSGLPTWNGTQLAVAWQRCPNDKCVGSWTLAYQGREGFIRVANASNWGNNTTPVVRTNAVSAGASLALAPALQGAYVDGMTLATQRRPGSMGRTTFLGDWNWKEDDGTIIDDVDPLKTRQFAATTMKNFTQSFFVSLSTDGSITGSRWDGKAYNAVPEITFAQGQSTNFSAIAMTEDAMFYGISEDQIWEYSVDTTDPSTFTLAGKVYP
ncbi:uncharacterized protein GGS22DRAFT_183749 [Annulohypoxylon maeteangense]|uniref:uncharacterized protein n=1 Tax=Annulohypoxylon maeteangense TaxID=1927788 RepID=UPI002007C07A|nr:uncharacterized protein GGS22DRAFT_183749 [Annulohypoxylon maeteangense]KAI0890404.1 hypothetical protein GGS22DRAFT_183749 [Annulohypoxylon maeteangense]